MIEYNITYAYLHEYNQKHFSMGYLVILVPILNQKCNKVQCKGVALLKNRKRK